MREVPKPFDKAVDAAAIVFSVFFSDPQAWGKIAALNSAGNLPWSCFLIPGGLLTDLISVEGVLGGRL